MRDIRSVISRDGEQNAIPPLDGALSPNDRLDACTIIGDPLPGLDDVIADPDGTLFVSAGRRVLKFSGPDFAARMLLAEFEGDAGGLALHPDGRLLVCVAGRGLAALDPARPVPRWLETVEGRALAGLLSVTAAPDGHIFAVEGSDGRPPDQWRHDLMEKRRNGRLVTCGAALDHANTLLQDLYYPYGVAVAQEAGKLWLCESWAHRVCSMELPTTGVAQPENVLRNLPGYPARMHSDG